MTLFKFHAILMVVLFAFAIGCGGKGKKGADNAGRGGNETAATGETTDNDPEAIGSEAAPEIVPEVFSNQPGGTALPPVPSAGAGTAPTPGGGVGTPTGTGGTTTGAGTPTGGGTTTGTGTGTAPAPTGTTGGTSGGTGQTPQIQIIGTWSPTIATADLTQIGGTTTSPGGSGQTSLGTVDTSGYDFTITATPVPFPLKDITTDRNFSEVPGADFSLLDGYGLSGLRPLPGPGSWALFRKKEGTACENFIETWVVVQFPSEQQYIEQFPDRDSLGNIVWRRPKDEWFDLKLKSCNADRSQCQDLLSSIPPAGLDQGGGRLELCPSDPYSTEPCLMWFHGRRDFACTQGEDVGQAEKYVISIVPNQDNPLNDTGPLFNPDHYLEVATPASLRP